MVILRCVGTLTQPQPPYPSQKCIFKAVLPSVACTEQLFNYAVGRKLLTPGEALKNFPGCKKPHALS